MRDRAWLMLAMVLAVCAGCASPGQETTPGRMMNRFKSLWAGLGPDAMQLEIAIVQQPLNDLYLSRDVWREVDEQVLPLERRPALQANGLRLGTITGTVPADLQRLLTGQRHTCIQGHTWDVSGTENDGKTPLCPHCQLRSVSRESFVTARRKGVRPNEPFFLPLGPEKPLNIAVPEEGSVSRIECDSAQAGLQIQLSLADTGEVTVHCEPRIQHGANLRLPQPSVEKDSWSFANGRPEHQFPKLAWEISLEPNEYLIVGSWCERIDTLGHRCFFDVDAGRQTLLVIRTARPQADRRQPALATKDTKPTSGPLPLALQSIMQKKPVQPPLSRGQSGDDPSP